MVRNYKRKSDRQTWDRPSMDSAVAAVVERKIGYHKASIKFGVPRTTLERYAKKMRNSCDKRVKVRKIGAFKAAFTEEQEKELCDYIVNMEKRLFALTRTELRSLAFQMAEKNGFNPFNKNTRLAGVDWLNGFLQRHPNISLRKPKATSAAKIMDFNKISAGKYFELLNNIIKTKSIKTGGKVFNIDETGKTVDPSIALEYWLRVFTSR